MPRATANGIELYFETAGQGRRLLVISGTGGDLRHHPNVLDGPLANQFSVLCYDQRGLGQSDKPDAVYTMADYADDAAGLLEHLSWPSCAVAGVSFGGMVAQELALRHPSLVERAVLACTSAGGAGGSSYPLHELDELAEEERAGVLLGLLDRRLDADWQDAHPQEAARQRAAFARPAAPDGEAAAGARRQLEARRHHDTWDRLGDIGVPVMVSGGLYDGVAPPENLERLASRIPGAELSFYEGGHMFLLQDPGAWSSITKFLDA
jgi:3-oxoadipate enol-lactonase